jgi:hypothetical protein
MKLILFNDGSEGIQDPGDEVIRGSLLKRSDWTRRRRKPGTSVAVAASDSESTTKIGLGHVASRGSLE